MKVLMINGSPHADGNTAAALHEMEKVFILGGIDVEIMQVGDKPITGCVACGSCGKLNKCVFDGAVNEAAEKFRECDGLVIGSPVY